MGAPRRLPQSEGLGLRAGAARRVIALAAALPGAFAERGATGFRGGGTVLTRNLGFSHQNLWRQKAVPGTAARRFHFRLGLPKLAVESPRRCRSSSRGALSSRPRRTAQQAARAAATPSPSLLGIRAAEVDSPGSLSVGRAER